MPEKVLQFFQEIDSVAKKYVVHTLPWDENMKKNLLTIIIQPDITASSKRIKSIISFSVHRRAVSFFYLMILLLVVFGLTGINNIKENISIRKEVTSCRSALQNLKWVESTVSDIKKDESIIRQSLGLEAWDSNFDINERLGRGGSEQESDFKVPDIDVEHELLQTEDRRPLHVRVHDLSEDVNELHTVLSKMRKTLDCRPTIMPVKDKAIWITSGFGWRKGPFTGLREFHKGLDISGRKGAPIIATASGVVDKVGYNRFKGKFVRIKHDDRFTTVYGHLMKYIVKKRQTVERGEIIGYMGTTGMSTGYHLHYVVIDNKKKVNPYNFILNRTEHNLAFAQ